MELSFTKPIPLQAWKGSLGSRSLELPQFQNNRHNKSGKFVKLTQRPSLLISVREWVYPQVHSAAGRIKSIKNPNDLIENRSRDFPACSAVPQPTPPPRTYIDFTNRVLYLRGKIPCSSMNSGLGGPHRCSESLLTVRTQRSGRLIHP